VTERGTRLIEAIERALRGDPPGPEAPEPWLGWLAVCLCRLRAHLDDGPLIDPHRAAHRLARLDTDQGAGARLARWLPGPGLLGAAIDELRDLGVIGHPTREHDFLLCERLEAVHAAVDAVAFERREVQAAWSEHLGDDDRATAAHRCWVRARVLERRRAYERLEELGTLLEPAELVRCCEDLIAGGIDGATGKAIEVLHGLDGPVSPAVRAVLDRLDPDRHHPYPAWAAARYLLARGVERERALAIAIGFAEVPVVAGYRGNPMQDRLAVLVLEHAQDRAMPLLRLALRSNTPGVLQPLAALLSRIAQPWCHRELEAALGDPEHADRPEQRRVLAAALARLDTDIARRRARELAPPVPERTPGAIGYTFDEVVAANLDSIMDDAAEAAVELADRLRARLPDDWNG
jgi:hypothetical protein